MHNGYGQGTPPANTNIGYDSGSISYQGTDYAEISGKAIHPPSIVDRLGALEAGTQGLQKALAMADERITRLEQALGNRVGIAL